MILRRIIKILLFTAAGLAALILLLLLGVELALDRAPRYQAQIKQWMYERTGYHITFAHVSPAFRWYGPELYFDRLELRSKDDRRVLGRAAGGRIGADIWQLLQNGKLFALRVELDSPDIAVSRLGPSRFAIASEIALGGADEGSFAGLTLNDLPAGTLVIHRGFITLEHWNSEMPELDLRDVSLDLTRVSHSASASLSAQLPSVLGGRLSFSGMARGVGALPDLEWHALVGASGISFAGWRALLPEYLTRLDEGNGGFQAQVWGNGRTLQGADLEFNAQGVVAKLADGPNAVLDQVSGALALTHAGDRWTLLGRRMRAVRDGRQDPDSELDVSWRDNDSGMLELHAAANYLRAEALLPLVGLMPQKDIRERLRDLAPTGEWTDLHLSLSRRSVSEPWQFDTSAKFRGMGFAPVGGTPGLRGLSGSLAGSETAGHLIIDAHAAVYNWPDQFPQPIDLPVLKSTVYWKRTAQELLVATSNLELRTRDASVRGKLAWAQPSDGSSPIFTMASTIDNGNAAAARFYFPHQLLAPAALQWLDHAFVAGHLSHGDAIFEGPVRRFPFRDGGGLFLIRFRVDHLSLDYREGWPRIDNIAAQAEFRNEGMSAKVTSAAAADLKVDSADVRFVDFKNGEMRLHAAAHGDASDALHYLAATPLDAMADHGFSSVEAKGGVKCIVDLFFPFKQFDQRRVLVHTDIDGATLNVTGSTLVATELTGAADIDGAQVVRADVHGRILDGAFQMTARVPRSRPVTRTLLDFRGTLSGESLRAALSLPANIPITGQTDWHGLLRIAPEPSRERSLRLTSNLAGLELKLPEPMSKPAGTIMPALLDIQWPAAGGSQLRFALASVLRGEVTLGWDTTGPRLDRAAVSFGGAEPAFSDAQTVNIGGDIAELDLEGWLKWISSAKSAKPLASYLRAAKFTVSRIDYLGLSFLDVTLALTEDDGGWRVALDGPNVVGSIVLPGLKDPSAPWDLDFERLKFVDAPDTSAGADQKSAADQENATDPRSLPAINFHAAALTWGDRQFGDVRATLVKVEDGISLKQLTATSPTYGASATGEWRGSSSSIKGMITSTDVGETMKQLGFDAVIDAKSGHVNFDMTWTGAPTGQSLAAATGHVQVALDKGQIVGLKPGAGRVLGLASVAELPRRLALDFSDLTDKGFAFDTVRGDFDLRDGNAQTDNILVKGPAAEIGLIGRVGLKNKDYDQIAVVTGNVSSTLALPAFAAGPVVGGVVLLFTQVFKQPLKGLVRGYYRITGSWDNPTVERIKSADAAQATAEAPKP
jgi:uncharacterized protein (TIGR02099 family)